MLKKNIDTFLGCDNEFDTSDIVLFGAPFDSTTSYRPGTRFGSKAIRNESFGIETYSPYQDKDLTDSSVFDAGDLELCFGDSTLALGQIQEMSETILKENKLPFLIGGEHLVTLGNVRATAMKYSDLHLIHFDAHADLRNDYLGATLSHASVIRRCHELLGDNKIYQFGIRSGEKSEFEFANSHTFLNKYNLNQLEECIEQLKGKPVYFTLDLDILDPSFFPGTGTPEPGGISFMELLDGVIKVVSGLNIVACDICELSPTYDQSGTSTITACKILREMLLALSKNN